MEPEDDDEESNAEALPSKVVEGSSDMLVRRKERNQVSGLRTKQPWMYSPRAKVRIQTSGDDTEVHPTRPLTIIRLISSNQLCGNQIQVTK